MTPPIDRAAPPLVLMPVPAPGQLRLTLVSLACTPDELARLQEFLSADELRRSFRLIDAKRRDLAIAGRGLVREMLAGYLGEEPGRILFSVGEFGKLRLSEQSEADSICFNLSHAGDQLLLAVSIGCEVGVDMELVRQDLPYRAMAERYFSTREQQELFNLAPAEQLAAFYRCWTRKEAYLKGTGTGFTQPANGFDVSLLPGHEPALLAHRAVPEETLRWSLRDVAMPKGYCAAVAMNCSRREMADASPLPGAAWPVSGEYQWSQTPLQQTSTHHIRP